MAAGISPGLGLSAALSVDLTSSPAGVPGAAQYEDFGLVVPAPGVSSFDLSHQTTIFGQRLVFTPSAGAYDVSLVSLP